MKIFFSTTLVIFISFGAIAQKGYLRGKVIDDEFGDGLIGATVIKQGSASIGTVTDFDGNYSLSLEPGTHSIVFSFVSFASVTVNDIVIKAGETTLLDMRMKSDMEELEAVVVTAEVVRNTEAAMLTVQKKSANLVDGVSSQTFKKVGDSDLGAAMKRVTGVTVQDGKYVYVRGLGDRYTKTTMNEMSIPGLNPDVNAVQMDIFPTSTIENVVVYKTFSPDLSGDFSGGTVDIATKSFPEEKQTGITVGIGYNPSMHLKENFVGYEGGKTDFLGFDDGTRELPIPKIAIPTTTSVNKDQVEGLTRSFNPTLSGERMSNFMNYSLSFNHGNQVQKKGVTFGYNAILNYSHNETFNENITIGRYSRDRNPAAYELNTEELRTYDIGSTETLWTALLSGSLKYKRSTYTASILRSQDGIATATIGNIVNLENNPSVLQNNNLLYLESSVTNGMLVGKHALNNLKVEWRTALSQSKVDEPDLRSSRLQIQKNNEGEIKYDLNTGVGAGIDRFYRNLNEINSSAKLDFTYDLNDKNKIKWGGLASYKQRDFEIVEYRLRVSGISSISGNPSELLNPENIWTVEKDSGTYVRGDGSIPSKSFNASQNVFGLYAMTELNLTEHLRAITGVRAESVDMYFTGQNQNGRVYNSELTLDKINLLPSLNLIYSLTDDMNLRASANRTLARPTFREKSNAQIVDQSTGLSFIGNPDLEQTNISNFDLRWELFYGAGEMISLSGFYKEFDGHIEMTRFSTDPNSIKPRNAGKSNLLGAEIEFRKNITTNFSFGTNASFVKSAIEMKEVIVDEQGANEYDTRKGTLREGQTLKETRPMSGQSPVVVNAFVNFVSTDKSINGNLSYNVQSETLSIVGSGPFPDVYTKPFHSLNTNIYKDFGQNRSSRVTIGVNNILDSQLVNINKSYKSSSPVYRQMNPGRTFSIKYGYKF